MEAPAFIRRKWETDEIIGAIQAFALRHGRPPTLNEWTDKARDQAEYPSSGTVTARFGSWNEGIKAAGFIPRTRGQQAVPILRSFVEIDQVPLWDYARIGPWEEALGRLTEVPTGTWARIRHCRSETFARSAASLLASGKRYRKPALPKGQRFEFKTRKAPGGGVDIFARRTWS